MRIERARRWPAVPPWALAVVTVYLGLVALAAWISRTHQADLPVLCMFRRVTQYPCPGCGTTRMVLAVAAGRWSEAAAYNPLALGLVGVGIVLLSVRLIFRRRIVWITSALSRRLLTALLVLAVLGNWLYLLAVL